MKPCKSYSRAYSLEVWGKYREKYARATKIFRLISNHGPDYPAWLFGHDQPKWNRYKKIIRIIQLIDLNCQPCHLSSYYLSFIEDELAQNEIHVAYSGIDFTRKA